MFSTVTPRPLTTDWPPRPVMAESADVAVSSFDHACWRPLDGAGTEEWDASTMAEVDTVVRDDHKDDDDNDQAADGDGPTLLPADLRVFALWTTWEPEERKRRMYESDLPPPPTFVEVIRAMAVRVKKRAASPDPHLSFELRQLQWQVLRRLVGCEVTFIDQQLLWAFRQHPRGALMALAALAHCSDDFAMTRWYDRVVRGRPAPLAAWLLGITPTTWNRLRRGQVSWTQALHHRHPVPELWPLEEWTPGMRQHLLRRSRTTPKQL